MTTYIYSEIINTTVSNFDPTQDVLNFDGDVNGSDLTFQDTTDGLKILIGETGNFVILAGVLSTQIDADAGGDNDNDANVTFETDSLVYIGDDNVETDDDASANEVNLDNFDDSLLSTLEGDDEVQVDGTDSIVRLGQGDDEATVSGTGHTVYLGAGDDAVVVDSNADDITVYGRDGNDTITGGDNDDTIEGNKGNDSIDGGAGDDTIGLGLGDDTATGGNGDDAILGRAGNDSINGGDGSDTINGEAGDDTINGGVVDTDSDDDELTGGDGADTFQIGTAGAFDVAALGSVKITDFSSDDNVEIFSTGISFHTYQDLDIEVDTDGVKLTSVANTQADDEFTIELEGYTGNLDESLIVIENDSDAKLVTNLTSTRAASGLIGDDGDDLIVSTDAGDYLDGGDGDDRIVAGAGNDTVVYDANDSTVLGGEGTDTLKITKSSDSDVTFTLSDGSLTGFEKVLVGKDFDDDVTITVANDYDADDAIDNADLEIDGSRMSDDQDLSVTIQSGFENNVKVTGGAGNDSITHEDTSNVDLTILAGGGDDKVTVQFDNLNENDDIRGGTQDDSGDGDALTIDGLTDGDKLRFDDELASITGFEKIDTNDVDNIEIQLIDYNVTNNLDTKLTLEDLGEGVTVDSSRLTAGTIAATFTGGNNTYISGSENAELTFSSGDDTFEATAAGQITSADTVDGGTGANSINIDFDGTVTADDLSNFSNFEEINYTGSAGLVLEISDDYLDNTTNNVVTINIDNNDITLDTTDVGNGDSTKITVIGDGQITLQSDNTSADEQGSAIQITSGDANVTGSSASDDIDASGSDEAVIDGGAGDDTIQSGDGDDIITGGAGDDSITSGEGNDVINAGAGDDIIASDSSAVIDAGAGDDTITLSNTDASSEITGGDGDDTINLDSGNGIADEIIFNEEDEGVDTITGFEVGAGGDVLKFNFTLNPAGTTSTSNDNLQTIANATDVFGTEAIVYISGVTNTTTDAGTLATALEDYNNSSAEDNFEASDSIILLLSDGTDTNIWHLDSDGDAEIEESELTLLGTLSGIDGATLTSDNFAD